MIDYAVMLLVLFISLQTTSANFLHGNEAGLQHANYKSPRQVNQTKNAVALSTTHWTKGPPLYFTRVSSTSHILSTISYADDTVYAYETSSPSEQNIKATALENANNIDSLSKTLSSWLNRIGNQLTELTNLVNKISHDINLPTTFDDMPSISSPVKPGRSGTELPVTSESNVTTTTYTSTILITQTVSRKTQVSTTSASPNSPTEVIKDTSAIRLGGALDTKITTLKTETISQLPIGQRSYISALSLEPEFTTLIRTISPSGLTSLSTSTYSSMSDISDAATPLGSLFTIMFSTKPTIQNAKSNSIINGVAKPTSIISDSRGSFETPGGDWVWNPDTRKWNWESANPSEDVFIVDDSAPGEQGERVSFGEE